MAELLHGWYGEHVPRLFHETAIRFTQKSKSFTMACLPSCFSEFKRKELEYLCLLRLIASLANLPYSLHLDSHINCKFLLRPSLAALVPASGFANHPSTICFAFFIIPLHQSFTLPAATSTKQWSRFCVYALRPPLRRPWFDYRS
jgi:hypothetical protein